VADKILQEKKQKYVIVILNVFHFTCYANRFPFILVFLRNSLHPLSKLSLKVAVYIYFGYANKADGTYLYLAVPVTTHT
jgi:hypothetical protein